MRSFMRLKQRMNVLVRGIGLGRVLLAGGIILTLLTLPTVK
ncbi:MAG: hypothetical protein ACRDLU_01510 [Gaiellaceae bacterium]|jgi:ABC-type phosphate transport system permease subunit